MCFDEAVGIHLYEDGLDTDPYDVTESACRTAGFVDRSNTYGDALLRRQREAELVLLTRGAGPQRAHAVEESRAALFPLGPGPGWSDRSSFAAKASQVPTPTVAPSPAATGPHRQHAPAAAPPATAPAATVIRPVLPARTNRWATTPPSKA